MPQTFFCTVVCSLGLLLPLVPAQSRSMTAPQPEQAFCVRVYLNPNTGRFWTMDSYAGDNQDPVSLHKYLYGADNPVNGIDPSGHDDLTLGSVLTASAIGATIGGFSAATLDVAQGRAITAASIFQGAAYGAVLGPYAAAIPEVGVGLGVLGLTVSGSTAYDVFTNPNSTPAQRASALALIVSSAYGTRIALEYSRNPNISLPQIVSEEPSPIVSSSKPILPNPITAQAGTVQRGVNPAALRAGDQMRLQSSRLVIQKQLIQSGTKRYDPIIVSRQGVIYQGTHGARAAADLGTSVDVIVVDLNIQAGPPVTELPVQ